MNEPHDPNRTVDVPSTPADSLDAGLAAGFGRPADGPGSVLEGLRSNLGPLRPVLLHEAEGDSAHIVKPSSDAMPPPEETGTRYQLQGEIARGGMGAVLRGRDMDLGRDLAIKVLLEKHANRPEVARRFIEEAQIGGQLQHPGVVPVYDIGRFGDRPFFTMKLVKGQTLAALLAERVARKDAKDARNPEDSLTCLASLRETFPRFLAIALQVVQAMAYAHAKAVIHRDLKPANIMVGAFGEVQVMDWGLAKVLAEGGIADEERTSRERERPEDVTTIRTARSTGSTGSFGSDTEAGALLGTPAYMPPEQANGEVALLDRRADVFGLGAILCEILTGKPPYVGRSSEEVRRKAANGDLADATARLEACGADQDLVVLTKACLSPEAIDRPKDARAVADALAAYLDGVQERLHQAELAEAEAKAKAVEEAKRRRLTLALAATVLLALTLGGGGWLWWKTDRDTRRARMTSDVNEALSQAAALREKAKAASTGGAALFAQAREQTQRALALVESGPADAALKEQVWQLQAELDDEEKDRALVAALDEARLAQAETVAGENRFADERAVPLFRAAFAAYGLAAGQTDPTEAAQRIRQRPAAVRDAIVAALDEWDALAGESRLGITEPHRDWLRAVLAAAEPDDAWSRQLRTARAMKGTARRRAALEKLATSADVAKVPARALTQLARQLAPAPQAALLRRAQAQYPADFWINHNLGMVLRKVTPPEWTDAVRFLTAAAALRPDNPGCLINLGMVLKNNGQLDEAIACCRKAIQIDPNYAIAHNNLGADLSDKGQLDEAIDCYQKAIEVDPHYAPAHANLGGVLASKGQLDKAIACFRKAIEVDSKFAPAYSELGGALKEKGELDKAIANYRKAIELDPRLARALTRLGKALQQKGQLEEADAYLRKAIDLEPNNAEAHRDLGVLLCDHKHEYAAAILCFKKAIELEPKNSMAHADLGTALRGKGQMEQAVACWRKAIELDPKNAQAHSNLGAALSQKGQVDEAIASLRRAIELDPSLTMAHANLGNALKRKGQMDEAIACFRKAIELDPKNAGGHMSLGIALGMKGQVDEAIASLRKAIALDPKSAESHYSLGLARYYKGQVDEAIVSWRKAIELDPKNARAHHNLGQALSRSGQVDEAIACWRKASALDAKLAEPLFNLGDALLARGEVDAAIASFRKYILLNPKDTTARYYLGNALEAKGQLDDAIASYQKAIELQPKLAEAYCNLGNALQQQGRFVESLSAYKRGHELGRKQLGWRYPSAQWVREAESMVAMEARLPAFLKGEFQPTDTVQRLGLVGVCHARKLNHAAARLYADAFAADPKLADELKAGHRYSAACLAALAGAGKGEDAAKLVARERARLRQQALAWLRADLALYTKLLGSGQGGARAEVQRALRHWQKDADLAGIRDMAALAKLPPEERAACEKLWADVAVVLKKAETPAKKEGKR
jgi:serine/threonine-protein kinase